MEEVIFTVALTLYLFTLVSTTVNYATPQHMNLSTCQSQKQSGHCEVAQCTDRRKYIPLAQRDRKGGVTELQNKTKHLKRWRGFTVVTEQQNKTKPSKGWRGFTAVMEQWNKTKSLKRWRQAAKRCSFRWWERRTVWKLLYASARKGF